ncbi:unnamed protein product [Diamesa serratosioi]
MGKTINEVSRTLHEISNFVSYDDTYKAITSKGYDSYTKLRETKGSEESGLMFAIADIANFCFDNGTERYNEFLLNSELYAVALYKTAYGMDETIFNHFKFKTAFKCISNEDLIACEHGSFDGEAREEFEIIPILNGSVCNFNLQKMMECYKSKMETCGFTDKAVLEMTKYIYEVILNTSKCKPN